MASKPATVADYLASQPADRRAAIEAVRAVILKNLDSDYEEGMQYGMIGYYVPHRVYPAGYHCDPKQPLPFAGLASQKGHMSLYIMGCYGSPEQEAWFRKAWTDTGRKLDMGKACIRFKKLEDVALDVVGEAFRRMPATAYIAQYEANLTQMRSARTKAASAVKTKAASTAKKKVLKTATKPAKSTPKTTTKKASVRR
jgi:hypothetical protein